MRITGIDVVGKVIPMDGAFPVSYQDHGDTEHVFVRIHTDGGHIGYGEGTSLPWFTGEVTAGMVDVVERWIRPRVIGVTLDDALTVLTVFTETFPNAPGATSSVELALLDLKGKQSRKPVSELLGPIVSKSVPIIYIIPALAPEDAAARASDGVADGFRHFKVKANGDVESDVERINAVLNVIPEDGTLRVDANTGWEDASTALRATSGITSFNCIEYFEQPTAADRPEDMRELWDKTGVPVFADESVHNSSDLERLGEQNIVSGSHLKLAKTGSLRSLRDLATVADQYGLTVSTVSAFGTSLEAAANLHLSATVENMSTGCELCMNLLSKDVAEPRFAFEPVIEVPTKPGLGVSLPDALFD